MHMASYVGVAHRTRSFTARQPPSWSLAPPTNYSRLPPPRANAALLGYQLTPSTRAAPRGRAHRGHGATIDSKCDAARVKRSSAVASTASAAVTVANSPDAAAAPLAGAEPASTSEAVESKLDGNEFVWTRHWWPLFPVSYLAPDRPTPVTLLGMPLVVWRDGSGEWRVFRDRCPHRLAPLSEGRVEADGSLACSYHGWRFDGSGACRRIPQAVDAAAEAAACASRRSCATSYPVRNELGLLWVWPDDSPDAAAAAAASTVLISNDLRRVVQRLGKDGNGQQTAAATPPSGPITWFMRDLPYSYEILMENLTDPSHLPYSHHNKGTNLDRSKGGAMPMKPSSGAANGNGLGKGGAAIAGTAVAGTAAAGAAADLLPPQWARPSGPDFEYDFLGNLAPDATVTVHMPHHIMYTYRIGQSANRVELLFVPVAPGRSRFFAPFALVQGRARPLPPLSRLLSKPGLIPLTLLSTIDPVLGQHMSLSNVLDGDSVFLSVQDELVRGAELAADMAEAATMVTSPPATSALAAAGAVTPGEDAGATTDSSPASSSACSASAVSFWSRLYYLPAQADGAVLAARRWLEERAGGGPFRVRQRRLLVGPGARSGGSTTSPASSLSSPADPSPPGLVQSGSTTVPGEAPDPQGRVRRLDRYEQHTRHCPICRTRLQQLQQLAAAAAAVQKVCVLAMCVAGGALGAALTAAGAAPWGPPAMALAGLAALWAAAGRLAAAVARITQLFTFQDYVHAEKD